MLLVTAATRAEICALQNKIGDLSGLRFLMTGVGCLETAVNLSSCLLSPSAENIDSVINFGIAGAFPGKNVGLLDICLARSEAVADFGICYGNRIVDFDEYASAPYEMDSRLLHSASKILARSKIDFHIGNFVSVNSVSATQARAENLRDRFNAICENMEGAAIARVCFERKLPCLELRCVSNMVEDRDLSKWQIEEAIEKGATAAVKIIQESLL